MIYCAAPSVGGYINGEKTVPLSYEGAQKWAKNNMNADDYLKVFEEDSKDGDCVIMTVQIKASTRAKLERLQSKKEMSMSAIINEAVERL